MLISNSESEASLECATDCYHWLSAREMGSVLCNSGNGAHLLIPVDLPNDEASIELVKGLLLALDTKFSNEQVKIDIGTASADT